MNLSHKPCYRSDGEQVWPSGTHELKRMQDRSCAYSRAKGCWWFWEIFRRVVDLHVLELMQTKFCECFFFFFVCPSPPTQVRGLLACNCRTLLQVPLIMTWQWLLLNHIKVNNVPSMRCQKLKQLNSSNYTLWRLWWSSICPGTENEMILSWSFGDFLVFLARFEDSECTQR